MQGSAELESQPCMHSMHGTYKADIAEGRVSAVGIA